MSKYTYIFFIITFIIVIFSGCSQKQIEPIYIKTKAPILDTYNSNLDYQFGKLVNKGNDVCILKWNTCIPKNEFIELVNYIQTIKGDLNKYNNEISLYNKWAIEQNK